MLEIEGGARLFTVPYFFCEIAEIERVLPLMVAVLIFKCTERAGVGNYSRFLTAPPPPLSSFDTHPR